MGKISDLIGKIIHKAYCKAYFKELSIKKQRIGGATPVKKVNPCPKCNMPMEICRRWPDGSVMWICHKDKYWEVTNGNTLVRESTLLHPRMRETPKV